MAFSTGINAQSLFERALVYKYIVNDKAPGVHTTIKNGKKIWTNSNGDNLGEYKYSITMSEKKQAEQIRKKYTETVNKSTKTQTRKKNNELAQKETKAKKRQADTEKQNRQAVAEAKKKQGEIARKKAQETEQKRLAEQKKRAAEQKNKKKNNRDDEMITIAYTRQK
jgi:outer membrane biosynthesis protein TonB